MKHLTIIAMAIILASCTTVPANFSKNVPANSDEDVKAAICEWTKTAGLPHTAMQSRSLIMNSQNIDQSIKDAYQADLRRVVITSIAQECLCGTDARKIVLQCDQLEQSDNGSS